MESVLKEIVAVRVDKRKIAALDQLAGAMDRDRSYLINEAVDAYLEIQDWQLAHIREGLRQAETGALATDAEVAAVFRQSDI